MHDTVLTTTLRSKADMVPRGRRWSVRDRYGHEIYPTNERWEHIISPTNHPEMVEYEEHLKEVLRHGSRKQDTLNPRKYRYSMAFDDLVQDNTHIVAIVLFSFVTNTENVLVPNNYVTTAYQKEVG